MRQLGGEGAGLIPSPHIPDELGDYRLMWGRSEGDHILHQTLADWVVAGMHKRDLRGLE